MDSQVNRDDLRTTTSSYITPFLPLNVEMLSPGQVQGIGLEMPYSCLSAGKSSSDWTVMVYLNGDNNLELAALYDFLEMSAIGSTNDVNIVVLFDRIPGYSSDYGDWTGTQAGIIFQGDEPFSNWGNDWGELNMGDPSSLSGFVNAAVGTFPANNYALVVWDHGGGWLGSSVDESSGYDFLTQEDISNALSSIPVEIDLFAYDACSMGTIECAYEVSNYASVFVASQASVPGFGFPFDEILDALVTNPNLSPQQLGTQIVSNYAAFYDFYGQHFDWDQDGLLEFDQTMSSVNLNSIGQLATQMDELALAFINNATSADYYLLGVVQDQLIQEGCGDGAVDLGNLLGSITSLGFSNSIQVVSQAALNTYFGASIVSNYAGDDISGTGLSIYFPDEGAFNPNYTIASSFATDTNWDEFLHWFGNFNYPQPFQVEGYFNFAQLSQFQWLDEGVSMPVSPIEMGGIPLALLYDETYYLAANPDVAAAVHAGGFSSGFDHLLHFGLAEGRDPSILYDEGFYLTHNQDVAQAVANDVFSSGLEHFLLFGHWEGRDPCALFDQSDYLMNNPDVAGAVNTGFFDHAFEHYILHGINENRLPSLSLYNEGFYLQNNSDVAAAVAVGVFSDGFEHYVLFGQREGRDPSALFDESAYLANNPDVAAAVIGGGFSSGFDHFVNFGRMEGREA